MSNEPKHRYYIETNIFVDHIIDRNPKSSEFLSEVVEGNIEGFTSHFTLSEIIGALKSIRAQGELNMSDMQMNYVIEKIQSYPNLEILFHDEVMFQDMPNNILETCAKTRDALHLQMALNIEAEYIVTRDGEFADSVLSLMKCAYPEDLLPND